MIEAIQDVIKFAEKDRLASDILYSIEYFGMLPPLRKSTLDDFTNSGFDQDFLDEHDFKTNGWEKEVDE